MFADGDLGGALPDSVGLIRKLIPSNGLFGSAAGAAARRCVCRDE